MQRSFYNEDFEELIREKSDQYKMYPSERVWKGIRRSLHSSRRWYWLSFILFLTGVSYFVAEEFTAPAGNTAKSPATSSNNSTVSSPTPKAEPSGIIPFTSVPANSKTFVARNTGSRKPAAVIDLYPVVQQEAPDNQVVLEAGQEVMPDLPDFHDGNSRVVETDRLSASPVNASLEGGQVFVTGNEVAESHAEVVDLDLKNTLEKETPKINWLQQNAMYELHMNKPGRLGWQVSFSPTMNYRKLFGNSSYNAGTDIKSVPIAGNIQGDIDHLVNHKPAVGFELGSFVTYKLNRNLTLKTGLQFNYSQYDIQAYGSNSSEVATIALNNFSSGYYPDSLTSLTRIRNFGGNERKDLRNQYFQLSAPVGVEFLVFGNRRIQFSVAGSVQPTYLMNRDTYLITTDYKNYTREPSLVRRWNVNTSAEAFISYQAAGLKWQLGPQFRYQLLSSYSNKYPIKEYLMEYGVKVGISKTFR